MLTRQFSSNWCVSWYFPPPIVVFKYQRVKITVVIKPNPLNSTNNETLFSMFFIRKFSQFFLIFLLFFLLFLRGKYYLVAQIIEACYCLKQCDDAHITYFPWIKCILLLLPSLSLFYNYLHFIFPFIYLKFSITSILPLSLVFFYQILLVSEKVLLFISQRS